eukprot:2852569-Prymnesium_polylepis.1
MRSSTQGPDFRTTISPPIRDAPHALAHIRAHNPPHPRARVCAHARPIQHTVHAHQDGPGS